MTATTQPNPSRRRSSPSRSARRCAGSPPAGTTFARIQVPSMFYGACFAVMGFLIQFVFGHAYQYVSALVTGFFLVGPFLAIGLYDLSRRRELGQPAWLAPTLDAWRPNVGSVGMFALVLAVILLVWARASLVVFALFFTYDMPDLHGFLAQVAVAVARGIPARLSLRGRLLRGAGIRHQRGVGADDAGPQHRRHRRGADQPACVCGERAGDDRVGRSSSSCSSEPGSRRGSSVSSIVVPVIGHATWHAYRALVR